MYQRLFPTFKILKTRRFWSEFTFVSFMIASWVPALIFFNQHVAELYMINGSSMYPFLNTGYNESLKRDLCLTYKWKPHEGLQRGMLVSFWSPYSGKLSIKRIIALAGDRVYTRAPYPYPYADVPAGHVWVEGDNVDSNKTLDSNHYGPISICLITAKVTHILWPRSSFGPIRWWEYKGRTRVIKDWNNRG